LETSLTEVTRADELPASLDQNHTQELANTMLRRLPFFHGIALRRLGNVADAEDAVQDAFLSAYTHLGQFKGQARMATWLTTIVINSTRMKARGRSRQFHIPLDAQDGVKVNRSVGERLRDTRPNPEEACRRQEFRDRLAQLSTRLSPSMRRTFQLYAMEGLSISETARRLGVTNGAVKARVSRARARLRRLASAGNNRKSSMA
jgi:RNA polymerase sigma-70 factor (ECF subfamily)